jgi:hypothetical protein
MSCVDIDCFFVFGEQIEKERANTRFTNGARDKLIARTMTATSRTVGKQNNTLRLIRKT